MTAIEPLPSGSNEREPLTWLFKGRALTIDRPIIVGVLNVTPDSFSDGGLFESIESALAQVDRMVEEGADAIDVGGESTRPQGARQVSSEEETNRVVPIVSAIRQRYVDLPISVDTTKADVASTVLGAGADIVNDVSGFRMDPKMGEIAAATGAGVILMHSRGSVEEMGTYKHANYGEDMVADVRREIGESVEIALKAGVRRQAIVLDPGIGFAKRSEHSLQVLAQLDRLAALGYPIMVGVSRKRFVGELSGIPIAQARVAGTVGANVEALMRGARLFRVHDVGPNRQALDVAWGVEQAAAARPRRSSDAAAVHGSRFPVPGSQSP